MAKPVNNMMVKKAGIADSRKTKSNMRQKLN